MRLIAINFYTALIFSVMVMYFSSYHSNYFIISVFQYKNTINVF